MHTLKPFWTIKIQGDWERTGIFDNKVAAQKEADRIARRLRGVTVHVLQSIMDIQYYPTKPEVGQIWKSTTGKEYVVKEIGDEYIVYEGINGIYAKRKEAFTKFTFVK